MICFPSHQSVYENSLVECSPIGERTSLRHSPLISSSDRFVHENPSSGLFLVTRTPLPSFLRSSIGMRNDSSSSFFGLKSWETFWSRFSRWLHLDSRPADDENDVDSKILNYSVYRKLFISISRVCTIVTWIASIGIFLLHFPTFRIPDIRMILVTFLLCPLALTVLETLYESLYLARTRACWTFLRVSFSLFSALLGPRNHVDSRHCRASLRSPRLSPQLTGFVPIFGIPLIDSIASAALLSLPHCTNFNVLTKNVVCRDYPSVWGWKRA